MATLEENIAQAISDFDNIKSAIKEKGVAVPYGTDTSEYGNLIRSIPQGNEDAAFEAGKQAEHGAFWDEFQQNGDRTDYSYAFATTGWTESNCRPKYLIKPTKADYMFYQSNAVESMEYWKNEIANGIDWSVNTSLSYAFQNNTTIHDIDEIGASNTIANAFNGCSNLQYIGKLVLPTTISMYACMNTFKGCALLDSLGLEGNILHNSFSVQDSPLLSHGSLIGILNALVDRTGNTSTTWTVTLGAVNIAKLTEEELDIAYNKNWVVN